MKNNQTSVITRLPDESIGRKLLDVAKKIGSMFGYLKVILKGLWFVKRTNGIGVSEYRSAGVRYPHSPKRSNPYTKSVLAKLEGAPNFPMPPVTLTEAFEEMKTAVEKVRNTKELSEKRKRRGYKLLRRRLKALTDMDERLMQAGFNVKKD